MHHFPSMNAPGSSFGPAATGPAHDAELVEEYRRYAAIRDFHWNVPAAESRRLYEQFVGRYKEFAGMLQARFTTAGNGSSPFNHSEPHPT